MNDKELKQSIDALRAVIILATKAMQEVVTEVKKKQNEFPKFAITSGWNPETDIEHKIKKWCDAINKLGNNNNDKPEPNDPLSGMYDDEKKYPDYVCIKDYSDSKKGDIFKYQFVNNIHKYAYENCTSKKSFCYSHEYFINDPEHFVIDEQWKILNGYPQGDGTVFVDPNHIVPANMEMIDKNIHPDYVCIKDYGQMKVGNIIKYQWIENYNEFVYAFIDKQNMIINSTKEDLEKNTEHFKKVEKVETFNENKRFNDYICVKDFRDLKVGDVLKFDRADSLLHEYIFICHQANDGLVLMNIDMIQKNPSHFVEYNKTVKSEYAFKMQKNDGYYANQKLVDQDKIEFHDKDGFAWFVITKSNKFWQDFAKKKAEEIKPFEIKKNADGSYYFEIEFGKIEAPLADLQKEVEIEKHCEELIAKFMPLVTKCKFEGPTIVNQEETYSGVWSYSDNNKRKAAIKVAIKHCELNIKNHGSGLYFETMKSQLQKMLSE